MIGWTYRQFERWVPRRVRAWAAPAISSAETLRQFLAYAAIGIAIAGVDFAILAALLHFGVYRPLSVSIAFITAGTIQFVLNKYWNFKSHNRSISAQVGTYVVLSIVFWVATVAWVELAVGLLHVPALIAKLLFIPVNAVAGFLSVRYLAFGKGIRGAIGDVLKARRNP